MQVTSEPTITIDGHTLTEAQASCVRSACATMLAEMTDPDALGPDAVGRAIAAAYREHLGEVLRLMVPPEDSWTCQQCQQQNLPKNSHCFLCARPRRTP